MKSVNLLDIYRHSDASAIECSLYAWSIITLHQRSDLLYRQQLALGSSETTTPAAEYNNEDLPMVRLITCMTRGTSSYGILHLTTPHLVVFVVGMLRGYLIQGSDVLDDGRHHVMLDVLNHL